MIVSMNFNINNNLLSTNNDDWGWYIDFENENKEKDIPARKPFELDFYEPGDNYSIDMYDPNYYYDSTYYNDFPNFNRINFKNNQNQNKLFEQKSIIYEFIKKPSTELFVTVGSTTIISSIMAYVIFFVL